MIFFRRKPFGANQQQDLTWLWCKRTHLHVVAWRLACLCRIRLLMEVL
uniref:Uncharacterized protein n=1 Tax=Rhizophora mucronata TaxID=61149 RepID=A0A2P2QYX8_RHIMU